MSKKAKEVVSTILIRQLSDFDQEALANLMNEFGEKTASQTVIKLIRSFSDIRKRLDTFEKLNATLVQENTELRKKLDNLRNSLKDLDSLKP